jgi:hypothetical protein
MSSLIPSLMHLYGVAIAPVLASAVLNRFEVVLCTECIMSVFGMCTRELGRYARYWRYCGASSVLVGIARYCSV